MTVPDPTTDDVTALAAEDVIKEALAGIDVTIGYRDDAGDDAWTSGTIDADDRRTLTAAVVAAIRDMTAEQQADRIGGTAERRSRSVYEGIYLADEQAEARPVGPWRAEP